MDKIWDGNRTSYGMYMVPSFVKFQAMCIHYRSVSSNNKVCYMLKDSKESEGILDVPPRISSEIPQGTLPYLARSHLQRAGEYARIPINGILHG